MMSWTFVFNSEMRASENVDLDEWSAFLIGKTGLSIQLHNGPGPRWEIVIPNQTSSLPQSIISLGEKAVDEVAFQPKYWVIRNLLREGNAAKIAGTKINTLLLMPWEMLFSQFSSFHIRLKISEIQRVPNCNVEDLIQIELCTDHLPVAKMIARWLNGRIRDNPKDTYAYSSELMWMIRPPISLANYHTRGVLSTQISVLPRADNLMKHCLICGQAGSGKTNSAKVILDKILYDGYNGNIIVLDNKGEYQEWAKKNKIIYLDIGRKPSLLATLDINPFIPPSETRLITHIELLAMILSISGFTGSGVILPEYMKFVLLSFFAHLWNVNSDNLLELLDLNGKQLINCGYPFRGENGEDIPFLINKFWETFQSIGFDQFLGNTAGRSSQDIKGIISARINSLRYSPINHFSYHQKANLPDHLLNFSGVLSFQGTSDNHLTLLTSLIALLFSQSARMRPTKQHLENIMLVEEAHLILKRESLNAEIVTAEGLLGQTFERMIAELRSRGIGFIIVDQSPSQLVPNVIANTSTKLIHRLSSPSDVREVSEAIGLLNSSNITLLNDGVCFYKVEGGFAIRIAMPPWSNPTTLPNTSISNY